MRRIITSAALVATALVGSGITATTALAATAPAAPTNVLASPADSQATVSWTAPSNGGSAITSYNVTSSPGGITKNVTAPAGSTNVPTTTAVTGLTNGTSYTFTVIASNAIGSGPASTASAAVTPFGKPGTPTNVAGTPGNKQVTVTWTAPSSNGAIIDSYTVTTSPGGTATQVKQINTSTPAPTTATITGLTNGTAYTFTVSAHNAAGTGSTSASSAAVTPAAVPGAPTNVTATAGNASANVSWTAPANNGTTITSYTITSAPGSVHATVNGSGGNAAPTTGTITGLTNGTTYTFTVTAHNAAGTGPASSSSNAVTPTGPAGAPTNVVGTPGDKQVTLTWTAPNNGGFRIDRYTVTASPGGVAQTANATSSTTAAPTTLVFTGLTNGTAYTFTVTAHTSAGTSPASAPSAAVTPFGLPGAPTNVVGSPGNRQVTLTWTAPSNNGARIDRYVVTTSPGGTTTTVNATNSTSAAPTTATITGLTNGTAYTFTVTAHNAAGTGAASPRSAAVTPAPPPATGAHATAGDGQATVAWVAPSVPSGDSIKDFVITATPGNLTRTVGPTTTSIVMAPLTNGTSYTFTVTTDFTSGTSSTSSTSNAVTPKFGTTLSAPGGTTTIRAGQAVVVTGFLTRSDGTGIAHADVVVTQRTGASHAFANVTTLTSGSDGSWTVSLAPTMHSTYMFSYSGDGADNAATDQTIVLVRTVVTWLTPRSGTTLAHGVVQFTDAVAGAVQGTKAALQYRRSDGSWHDLAYGFVTSDHRVSFTRSLGRGHWILRVAVARTAYDFGATTRAASLHLD